MLAFTSEIQDALELFFWTHEWTGEHWRRVELPDAGRGGLLRQDARLMLLLDEIRRTADEVARRYIADRHRDRAIEQWREERAKAARAS